MFTSDKAELIELVIGANGVVPAANSQFYFQDQPQLQSYRGNQTTYIQAIESFSSNTLTQSPLTSGVVVATPAQIRNAVLTLSIANTQDQRMIPLGLMNRVWNDPGAYTPHTWQPYLLRNVYQVDWTKSFVTILAGAVAPVPYSFLFLIHYTPEKPGNA